MDVIQTANKQVDKFGSGKHGFSVGNPSGGISATYISPEWCDNVQQEIINVIEGAGLAINPAQKNQMYQAIQAMIAGNAANDYKASVRAATTANIASLAGGAPSTLDGVTLVANDRILVKDQTTASQNGIYVVTTLGTGANGTWTRATDADGVGELTSGAIVSVEEGTTNADSQWMLTTDGTITIGTTLLNFSRTATRGTATTTTLSTGSGTYTTPAQCRRIVVRMVGGGGGGGGGGTTGSTSGGLGGDSSFNSVVAKGGNGGVQTGGAGGVGGSGGAGSATLRCPGNSGVLGHPVWSAGGTPNGGVGGGSAFAGGGTSGSSGSSNTGGGGGGGAASGAATGGGGGGGEYVEIVINNPAASYSYTVGAGGSAGVVGSSGFAGGAGGSGVIVVTEFF